MTNDPLHSFAQRYEAHDTPWDTGITPPEIVGIVQELPPGRALDLGCGTGTTLRYLLEHGWWADGVDFVPQAVAQAREKLAGFPSDKFSVYCHDITKLPEISGLRSPYDLVIDIGCGHGLPIDRAGQYAHDVAALMRVGGTLMLYAHYPTEGRAIGRLPQDVRRLFAAAFDLTWEVHSNDTSNGHPAGWYRLTKLG